MKKPLGKLRERQWSADMSNTNYIENNFKTKNNLVDSNLAKISEDKNTRISINSIEASTLINFDNIKISMINNNDVENNSQIIERDSLELKNINSDEKRPSIKSDNGGNEVFYGSPAIWLKNIKRKDERKEQERNNQNNLIKTNAGKSLSQSKGRVNKKLNFNKDSNFKNTCTMLNTINNFNIPKINLNVFSPTLKNETNKKIPLYTNNTSHLVKLDKIKTRNNTINVDNVNNEDISFCLNNSNLNTHAGNSIYKTLINNTNKFHNKNQERKFSNLNHGSKISNTTDKIDKTEIDEIINTEVSENCTKITINFNINQKEVRKYKYNSANKNYNHIPPIMLKNKILKLKTPLKLNDNLNFETDNLVETIFINSFDNSNGSKNINLLRSNSNPCDKFASKNSSSSDKNNICNIGSKTNTDSLLGNSNSNNSMVNSNKLIGTSSEESKNISSGSSGSNIIILNNINKEKKIEENKNANNIQNKFNNNYNNCNESYEHSENISASTSSNAMFKTIKGDKIQMDPYLNKTYNGKIKWKAGEVISEGSSSVVYKALNEDEGYIFVVKRYNKINDKKLMETFQNEVKIFQQLDHPNIIKYIDSEIMDNNFLIYLEYISGGSIKYILDKYGPLNENLMKIFLKQILEGLEYLHSKKIVHRDVKCANILLDVKGNIKLSDFGCSGQFKELTQNQSINSNTSDEFLDSLKGTLPWMAPEVILQKKYGKKADIWSLGCTLIEIATGNAPWGKLENCYQAMFKIGKSNDIPEIPSNLSENLKDLLNKCLKRNPKERMSVAELKEHQFLK